jgi:hypothetical protein
MKRLPRGSRIIAKTLDGASIRDRGGLTTEQMKEAGYVHGTWKYKRNRRDGSPYIRGWVKQ